jgi:hypothetical protein
VALYPGTVSTEFIRSSAITRGTSRDEAQTPLVVGRALAALVSATDVLDRSGSIQWVEDLAEELDVVDEHGRRPPPYRRRGEAVG